MNRYGQSLTYGPLTAPQLFTGDIRSYSLRDAVTSQDLDDPSGDITAAAYHSRKAALSFESEITSGSTDFLDLSTGGAIAVSTLPDGAIVLATSVVEKWTLLQRKTGSVSGTWYPDIVQADPVMAGTALDAFTPDQSALGIVLPAAKVIYSTYGMTHASGILHELTLTQTLQIAEDKPSPDGKILGAATHGYKRTINLLLLATGALPAVKSVLVLTGAPGHAADYRITAAEQKFERLQGKMYSIDAEWIPPFTA